MRSAFPFAIDRRFHITQTNDVIVRETLALLLCSDDRTQEKDIPNENQTILG